MTRRVATPGEVARWRTALDPLAPERRDAVIQMLCEVVVICPVCEIAVRRCDPRVRIGERLLHRDCTANPATTRIIGGAGG